MDPEIGQGRPIGSGGAGSTAKNLFKDKRFLAAGGVVVVLGALIAFRRGGDSNTAGSGDAAPSSTRPGYVQGYADTSGTDMASYLGTFTQQSMQQQQAFLDSLRSTLDQWKNGPDVDTPPPATTLGVIQGFKDLSPRRGDGAWWSDQQQLGWQKYAGATSYDIIDLVSGVKRTVGDVDSFWFNGLIPLGSYHYKIQAKDASGKVIAESGQLSTMTGKG